MRRSITLPCVLEAAAAKGLADGLLARAWAMRDRLVVRLTPDLMDLAPGDVVRPAGVAGDWIVDEVTIEGLVVTAMLRPAGRIAALQVADPGRPVSEPDIVALPLRLALFDLPDLGDNPPTGPCLQLAAASPSGTYRAAPIRIDGNGASVAGQTAAAEAVLGDAVGVLGGGQALVVDTENSVEVVLANPAQWLVSCDDAALAAGANLAVIGEEMIQFGSAEPIAVGRFRLSRLLRGRRGSEFAMAAHGLGEPFAMIDTRTMRPIATSLAAIGATFAVTAHGPGNDGAEPTVSRAAQGEAVRPLSPAQLSARRMTDGSIAIDWVHSSRRGWAWIDAVDTPPDPDVTSTRINLTGAAGTAEFTTAEPGLTIAASAVASLGAGPLAIAARQVGSAGLSRPATIILQP